MSDEGKQWSVTIPSNGEVDTSWDSDLFWYSFYGSVIIYPIWLTAFCATFAALHKVDPKQPSNLPAYQTVLLYCNPYIPW